MLQSTTGMDKSQFSAGIIFIWFMAGIIGVAYFIYGKKQQRYVPLVVGIALNIYPLFVSGFWPLLLVGIGLSVTPFFFRE